MHVYTTYVCNKNLNGVFRLCGARWDQSSSPSGGGLFLGGFGVCRLGQCPWLGAACCFGSAACGVISRAARCCGRRMRSAWRRPGTPTDGSNSCFVSCTSHMIAKKIVPKESKEGNAHQIHLCTRFPLFFTARRKAARQDSTFVKTAPCVIFLTMHSTSVGNKSLSMTKNSRDGCSPCENVHMYDPPPLKEVVTYGGGLVMNKSGVEKLDKILPRICMFLAEAAKISLQFLKINIFPSR